MLQCVSRNAMPGIADGQHDISARRHLHLARIEIVLVNVHVRGFDRKRPPVRHGITRVHEQVQKCVIS